MPAVPDLFAVLGVPRRFDLELTTLEQRYREQSREHHPDRFARAAPGVRLQALQRSTAVNQAYRTLKEPVARAEHLLALEGLALGEKDTLPQEFLLHVLEERETLEDAEAAGEAARADAVRARFHVAHEATFAEIAGLFGRWQEEGDRALLPQIKQKLLELRYHRRVVTGKDD